MPMKWHVRVSLGAGLGLASTLVLGFLLDGWIAPASVGALLAVVGFLGSFFVWSADIPPTPENPHGYEQVLFDRPNTVTSGILIAAMVLLGLFVPFDAEPEVDVSAYLASEDAVAADLDALYVGYANGLHAYDAGTVTADAFRDTLTSDRATALALLEDARALTPPDAYAETAKSLRVAAEQLSASMESMDLCLSGIEPRCQMARDRLADHEAAFDAFMGVGDDAAAAEGDAADEASA